MAAAALRNGISVLYACAYHLPVWRAGVAVTSAVIDADCKAASHNAITLMGSNEHHFYATIWESLFFSSLFPGELFRNGQPRFSLPLYA